MKFFKYALPILFVFWSCNKNIRNLSENDVFSIIAKCSFELTPNQGKTLDAFICDDIIFKYEQGQDIYAGPVSDIEKFKLAFRGKYHVDFFEKIHIDNKLYRHFLDSVQVLSIELLEVSNKSLLFECKSCNRVAFLKFRKAYFKFPFYTDQPLSDAVLIADTVGNYFRKIYNDQFTGLKGAYYESLDKNKPKISVTTDHQQNADGIIAILKSIKIKNTDQ